MSAWISRLAASAPMDDVTAALHEHGAVIVEGVLAADLLARFNAEIDPILDQVNPARAYLNPALDFFYGDRVRQLTGMATRSRVFAEEVLPHPFFTGVCDAILAARRDGNAATAQEAFNAVYGQVPGELAPKLALALACETGDEPGVAEALYLTCLRTDAHYTAAAAFGLSRVRTAEGVLACSVRPPEEEALGVLRPLFVAGPGPCSGQVGVAVRDGYRRLLAPAMETDRIKLQEVVRNLYASSPEVIALARAAINP